MELLGRDGNRGGLVGIYLQGCVGRPELFSLRVFRGGNLTVLFAELSRFCHRRGRYCLLHYCPGGLYLPLLAAAQKVEEVAVGRQLVYVLASRLPGDGTLFFRFRREFSESIYRNRHYYCWVHFCGPHL